MYIYERSMSVSQLKHTKKYVLSLNKVNLMNTCDNIKLYTKKKHSTITKKSFAYVKACVS